MKSYCVESYVLRIAYFHCDEILSPTPPLPPFSPAAALIDWLCAFAGRRLESALRRPSTDTHPIPPHTNATHATPPHPPAATTASGPPRPPSWSHSLVSHVLRFWPGSGTGTNTNTGTNTGGGTAAGDPSGHVIAAQSSGRRDQGSAESIPLPLPIVNSHSRSHSHGQALRAWEVETDSDSDMGSDVSSTDAGAVPVSGDGVGEGAVEGWRGAGEGAGEGSGSVAGARGGDEIGVGAGGGVVLKTAGSAIVAVRVAMSRVATLSAALGTLGSEDDGRRLQCLTDGARLLAACVRDRGLWGMTLDQRVRYELVQR